MANINELINLDINDVQKLKRSDLAKVVSQLSAAANKRVARLSQTAVGELSPAYQRAALQHGKFGAAGKNINQLRNEYAAVRDFLKLKTSTVSGWKKVRKNTEKRLGSKFTSVDQENRFWQAYRQLESDNYGAVHAVGSAEAQRLLRQEMEQNTSEDLIDRMLDRLDEEYERQQINLVGKDLDDYDAGDFFTIGDDDF